MKFIQTLVTTNGFPFFFLILLQEPKEKCLNVQHSHFDDVNFDVLAPDSTSLKRNNLMIHISLCSKCGGNLMTLCRLFILCFYLYTPAGDGH
jgi:hypothetical protein